MLKKWLANHYYDFLEERRLYNALIKFVEEKLVTTLDSRWIIQMLTFIQEKVIMLSITDEIARRHDANQFRFSARVDRSQYEKTRRTISVQVAIFKIIIDKLRRYLTKKVYWNMCFYGKWYTKYSNH